MMTYAVHLYHGKHSGVRRVKAETPPGAVEKVLASLGYTKYELEYHSNILYSEGAFLNYKGEAVAFAGIK